MREQETPLGTISKYLTEKIEQCESISELESIWKQHKKFLSSHYFVQQIKEKKEMLMGK